MILLFLKMNKSVKDFKEYVVAKTINLNVQFLFNNFYTDQTTCVLVRPYDILIKVTKGNGELVVIISRGGETINIANTTGLDLNGLLSELINKF